VTWRINRSFARRIDREHRLVYRVTPTALEIVQCRYHY
jgi:toxin YoeB